MDKKLTREEIIKIVRAPLPAISGIIHPAYFGAGNIIYCKKDNKLINEIDMVEQ